MIGPAVCCRRRSPWLCFSQTLHSALLRHAVGVGHNVRVGGWDGGAKSSGTVPVFVNDDDAVGYGIVLPQPVYLQTPRFGLLDLLELTGTLVLVVAGPRVDDYHGHGGLPRPDRPHGLGFLSSLDLRFVCHCKLHVHVGLGIGEGSSSVELLPLVANVLTVMNSSSFSVRVSVVTNSSVHVTRIWLGSR